MERFGKTLKRMNTGDDGFTVDDLSVIEPQAYRDRFLNFCEKVVFENVF